jgi:murein DD-endopeptidase MepM/ murein hydrolase activator NlpD
LQRLCKIWEKTSIDGTLRPRPPRRPRVPLYEFNQISPERLARQRAQGRRRFRTHILVLVFASVGALAFVPLRGHAHLGPSHFAAAYVPPVEESAQTVTSRAAQVTATPVAPQDVQYLRAPLVLDGVSQARNGGVPLQARAVQASPTATPGPTAAIPTPAADDENAGTASTPGPDASPTPDDTSAAPPAPVAVAERPNEPVQPADIPAADRHDPVQAEEHAAVVADLSRPLYYDHVVQPGDTVSTIAERYGVAQQTVLWNNPLITDKNALFIGQTLRVPATDGILYHVHLGDTVADIADEHKVDSAAVLSLAQNGLADANQIREGQTILIVGGQPPAPPPPPPPPPTPSPTPAPPPTPAPTQPPAPAQPPAAPVPPSASAATPKPPTPKPATPAPPAPPSSSGWSWPASGPITSYFGPAHPLGIDIGQGAGGQPILAAKAGTVTFAGGDACCSYGYYVDISHGGGWASRYGHCRGWPIVSTGQQVKAGQVLCYAGSTGYSTGPHLHFEIRLNGTPLNPLNFLP